jgi:hypothetical protein
MIHVFANHTMATARFGEHRLIPLVQSLDELRVLLC